MGSLANKYKVSSIAMTLVGLAVLLATAAVISTIVFDRMHDSEASIIKSHINDVANEIERGSSERYINKLSKKYGLEYHIDRSGGKYAVIVNLEDLEVCDKLIHKLIFDKERLVIDGNLFTTDKEVASLCQIPPVMISVVRKLAE